MPVEPNWYFQIVNSHDW